MLDQAAPRVALVTGSTSGIGQAIARRLRVDGYFVVLHSRSSAQAGAALVAELGDAAYLQADLADEAARPRLIADAAAMHNRLDVLVNNAGVSGIIPHANLAAATPAIWRTLHEVNVIAPFQLITAAEPWLRAASGCVVNISSHAGARPKGASIPYAASKAALNHMTKLLAVALAPDIRVNAIAPGLVDTPMTRNWEAAHALWRDRAPMGRAATPAEIAEIASLLVGSTYLTGEVILADGGLNLT